MKVQSIAAVVFTTMLWLSAQAWAAGLEISRTHLDFGHMKEGIRAEEVIVLKNAGSTTMAIRNVTTS